MDKHKSLKKILEDTPQLFLPDQVLESVLVKMLRECAKILVELGRIALQGVSTTANSVIAQLGGATDAENLCKAILQAKTFNKENNVTKQLLGPLARDLLERLKTARAEAGRANSRQETSQRSEIQAVDQDHAYHGSINQPMLPTALQQIPHDNDLSLVPPLQVQSRFSNITDFDTPVTSRKLGVLNPPPQGSLKGSGYLPWLALTEYEIQVTRKLWKNLSTWVPEGKQLENLLAKVGRGENRYRSHIMARRELGEDAPISVEDARVLGIAQHGHRN